MRLLCDVRVYGTPAPQGSKNPWGGEANKRTKPWRETVAQVVGEAVSGLPLCRGPVQVLVTFAFTRPKSHYRTGKNAGRLRDDAPTWHTAPNDLDKLVRAIGDALTGVVYADDRQIAMCSAAKIYAERAHAHIMIMDLSGGFDDTGRPLPSGEGADPDASARVAPPGLPGDAG